MRPADLDLRRKIIRRDATGLMAHQIVAVQIQAFRMTLFGLSTPGVKAGAIDDIGRNMRVIKSLDQRVVHEHILTTLLMLKLFDLCNQLLVMAIKRPAAD